MSPTVRNNLIYSPTHAYFPTIFTPPPTSDWPWPPTDWSPSRINTGHIQLVLTLQHLLKMEPIQCSETSVVNTQMPGKYPEDNLSLSIEALYSTPTLKVWFLKVEYVAIMLPVALMLPYPSTPWIVTHFINCDAKTFPFLWNILSENDCLWIWQLPFWLAVAWRVMEFSISLIHFISSWPYLP